MAENLIDALKVLADDKGIDELVVLEKLEQGLARSYKQILDLDWDAQVIIDRETGRIYVYEMVGQGEEDPDTGEYESYEPRDVTPDNVSRIAAVQAKRVINEIVRDAVRANIYREFADHVGELITGTVLQTTADFTVIKIRDGVEAELPHPRRDGARSERPRGERYHHNDRLKAIITEVRNPEEPVGDGTQRSDGAHATIVVSRTHPDLIKRLLELEVPEIYDGIVEVKAIAREAGARSKIAVSSREPRLDPVGACVGPKGSRIRGVVSELHGERIDVIAWSDEPTTFVANALSPAKVDRVLIDEESRTATVVVPDDQLSLAIGKEGQNARLAAHLTGWRIDIKSTGYVATSGEAEGFGSLIDDADEDGEESEEGVARCEHVSDDGVRCRNHARPGSRFCGVHASDEDEDGASAGAGAADDEADDGAAVADDVLDAAEGGAESDDEGESLI